MKYECADCAKQELHDKLYAEQTAVYASISKFPTKVIAWRHNLMAAADDVKWWKPQQRREPCECPNLDRIARVMMALAMVAYGLPELNGPTLGCYRGWRRRNGADDRIFGLLPHLCDGGA